VVLIVEKTRENRFKRLGRILRREKVIGSKCNEGIGDGREEGKRQAKKKWCDVIQRDTSVGWCA